MYTDTRVQMVFMGHGSVPKGNNRQAGASGREELHLSLTSGEIQPAASIKVKG